MRHEVGGHRAWQYLRQTLARLEADKLPPTPANYAVWYSYFSGEPPGVKPVIDTALAANGAVTDAVCAEVFQRFFLSNREERTVWQAADRVQGALASLLGLLEQSGADATRFDASLRDLSGRLTPTRSTEEVRGLIEAIIQETRLMVAHNQELQAQLQKSSLEMASLKQDLERVRHEASTDGLTGLYNRRYFDQVLPQAVATAEAAGTPLSLLMIDLDHFKQFNDTHGHALGDQVLALVARSITEGVARHDTAARYGGEEFAVILPGSGLDKAARLADGIRRSVASRRIVNRARNRVLGSITLSVGVAQHRRGESAAALVQRADAALYAAKNGGRNRVETASAI